MANGRVTVVQRQFREDLKDWVKIDRKVALKILELMEDVARDPFAGKGKPEPLKHLPGNVWCRRITQEHRLVYRLYDKTVDFLQCRYHY